MVTQNANQKSNCQINVRKSIAQNTQKVHQYTLRNNKREEEASTTNRCLIDVLEKIVAESEVDESQIIGKTGLSKQGQSKVFQLINNYRVKRNERMCFGERHTYFIEMIANIASPEFVNPNAIKKDRLIPADFSMLQKMVKDTNDRKLLMHSRSNEPLRINEKCEFFNWNVIQYANLLENSQSKLEDANLKITALTKSLNESKKQVQKCQQRAQQLISQSKRYEIMLKDSDEILKQLKWANAELLKRNEQLKKQQHAQLMREIYQCGEQKRKESQVTVAILYKLLKNQEEQKSQSKQPLQEISKVRSQYQTIFDDLIISNNCLRETIGTLLNQIQIMTREGNRDKTLKHNPSQNTIISDRSQEETMPRQNQLYSALRRRSRTKVQKRE